MAEKKLPVKLKPAVKDYIWGGTRLKTDFGKRSDTDIIAETWELSAHKNGQSKIDGGCFDGLAFGEYLSIIGKDALGTNAARLGEFPVLCKLIDARENLSVQVHPDDEYAAEHENSQGKTELWYVADCDEGAFLYIGVKTPLSKEEFSDGIKNGTVTEKLNRVDVKKGDAFLIKAGTVHAIGAGCLIFEIQQNSDCTYRVYDYGRVDKNGMPRELHIEKALDTACLTPVQCRMPSDGTLAVTGYFTVFKKDKNDNVIELSYDSFVSFTFTEGNGEFSYKNLRFPFAKGDTFFIPAQENDTVTINGDFCAVCTRV